MPAPDTAESLARLRSAQPGEKKKPSTVKEIAELPKKAQFPAMLQAFQKEIAVALPSHLTAERMTRLALTAFRQNPQLALCNPSSVFKAVVLSSQLGLELGVDGQAYMVPYKGEAQFIPGWKGLVELQNRAGKSSSWTGAVYKGDEFEYALGDSPHVTHRPMGLCDETPENLLYVYAVGRVHDAKWPVIEVWPIARVLRHRNKHNKVGAKHYSYANLEMYARKVVLLQVLKYMPKSVELRAAMALDREGSTRGVELRDVIEGEWSSVAADAEGSAADDESGHATDPETDGAAHDPATGEALDAAHEQVVEASKQEEKPEVEPQQAATDRPKLDLE